MFLLRLKWRKSGHSSSFCPVFSEPGLRLYALLQEIATASHSDSLTATKLLAFSRLPNYYVTTLPNNGNGHAPIQTGCPRCSSCQTCCWSARECRRDTEETDCGLQICSCTRVRRNSLCSRIILQSSETLAAAGAFTVTHTCTNKLEFLKEIFVSNHWKNVWCNSINAKRNIDSYHCHHLSMFSSFLNRQFQTFRWKRTD